MSVLRAGSNVDAWCTKCKLVLAHTIEAVADGVIKRVQCNTCRGKHQYKAKEPGSAKVSLSIKTALPKNKSKATDFTKLLEGKDVSKAAGYHTARHFTKGEVINHAVFGVGIVVDERDVSKIEVLFESGPKILIHART